MQNKILHSKIIGEGVPLVILHGFLGLSDNWFRLAKKWSADGFQVHLVDLRNHGDSFWDDEFNFEVLTEDLENYIRYYDLKRPHLLGHSLGGKILMFDSVKNKENRGKYIIVDISPRYYPPHHQYIFDAVRKINPGQIKNRQEAENILKKEIQDSFLNGFLLKSLKRTPEGFTWRHNWDVLENNMEEVGEALPPLRVSDHKILFIKGDNSPYITEQDFALIRAHFPKSEIVNIPHAGHLVHMDNPEEVYKIVKDFLLD